MSPRNLQPHRTCRGQRVAVHPLSCWSIQHTGYSSQGMHGMSSLRSLQPARFIHVLGLHQLQHRIVWWEGCRCGSLSKQRELEGLRVVDTLDGCRVRKGCVLDPFVGSQNLGRGEHQLRGNGPAGALADTSSGTQGIFDVCRLHGFHCITVAAAWPIIPAPLSPCQTNSTSPNRLLAAASAMLAPGQRAWVGLALVGDAWTWVDGSDPTDLLCGSVPCPLWTGCVSPA